MIQMTEYIYTVSINTNPESPPALGLRNSWVRNTLRGVHQEGHGGTCVGRAFMISAAGNRHVLWTACGRRGPVAPGMGPQSEGISSSAAESVAQFFVVIEG